jgi:hypothetical protein
MRLREFALDQTEQSRTFSTAAVGETNASKRGLSRTIGPVAGAGEDEAAALGSGASLHVTVPAR